MPGRLNLLAIALGRKQTLVLALRVVANNGISGAQDVTRGAIVLLQLDGLAVFKVLLKVQDVGDVGATPAINGLIVVAHDHEVLVLGGQQVGDLVLDVVGVLILVDANVAEALLVLVEHLGAGAQQLERAHEQIVEVHRVGGAQTAFQLQIDLRAFLSLGLSADLSMSSGPIMAFLAELILLRIMLMGNCFCSMPSVCIMSRTMRFESSSS